MTGTPETVTAIRIVSGLALVGSVGILVAMIWVSRIDSSLPTLVTNEADRQGDRTVLSLVREPFTTVEETYRSLHELEQLFREREDRRAVFLTVYVRVTREVAVGIERDEFENPEWVAEYLVTFANFYRRALLDFERGNVEALSGAWRLFFRATGTDDSLVIQSAVLGINAHINYDLALALHTVGIDRNRAGKYADHRRINEILWRLVDETLDRLAETYAPGLATIADVAGSFGEVFWFLALACGREGAWWLAVVLTESRWSVLQTCARWTMGRFSTAVAYVVLGPHGHSLVLDSFHKVEAMSAGR